LASSSKQKTTMAKLNRERRLRERRVEKQARKDERKRRAAAGEAPDESGLAGVEHLDVPDGDLAEALPVDPA
jgi:hypothetical protein